MSTDKMPDGWTRVTFGDVVRNVNENSRDLASDGLDRVVGLDHLDPGSLHLKRYDSLESLPDGTTFTRKFKPGQVLFGKRRAYQRKVAVPDFEGVCSGDILVFEPADKRMLTGFLPYLVQSDGFFDHALGTSAGSLSPRTKWAELAKYEFALPPLDEQERTVKMLSVADSVIGAYAELRLTNESFRESTLLDLIWDDSLKDWRVPLVRVADLLAEPPRNGVSPPAAPDGEGSLTVSISAVQEGRFVAKPEYLKWCRPAGDPSGFVVRTNDAFAVRGNGNRSLVGRLGLCGEAPPAEVLYPDLLIRLRFNPQVIDPEIATAVWNLRRVHDGLLARAKSSNGIYKVNGKDIANHRLPVPPLEVQTTVLRQLAQIGQVGKAADGSFAAAVQLRRSLLSRVLETNSHVH